MARIIYLRLYSLITPGLIWRILIGGRVYNTKKSTCFVPFYVSLWSCGAPTETYIWEYFCISEQCSFKRWWLMLNMISKSWFWPNNISFVLHVLKTDINSNSDIFYCFLPKMMRWLGCWEHWYQKIVWDSLQGFPN